MTEPEWVVQDPGGEWGVSRRDSSGEACVRPCAECPWRTDAPAGRFPDSVFEHSRASCVQPDEYRGELPPTFACHMTAGQAETKICAGFLAVSGAENWTVRIKVMEGQIDPDSLRPGDDWPELYESYEAMTEANREANARKRD